MLEGVRGRTEELGNSAGGRRGTSEDEDEGTEDESVSRSGYLKM